MSGDVPAEFVFISYFVLVSSMTFGSGLLLVWQRLALGNEIKSQAERFQSKLDAESQECRNQIDVLKQELTHRSVRERALEDLVHQHEQRWAYLALKGILPASGNINFTIGGDANIAGDVAGGDKTSNNAGSNVGRQ